MRSVFIGVAVVATLTLGRCFGSASNAVLWQSSAEITLSDWIWGPGGEARAPQPPFEFLEEDLKGTNAKIEVRDAKGDQYIAKFGGNNHSDVFASRLLHALGY